MNAGSRFRALGALGITVSMFVAACQAATVSPSPSSVGAPTEPVTAPTESAPAPSAEASVPPTPTAVAPPTATPQPAPTATPVPSAPGDGRSTGPGGTWLPAGSLAKYWYGSSAVPLRDGGALALDRDGTVAQRWDPATATWRPAAALNATRRDFAVVPLRDGRVLVTGGLDTHDWDRWQSYSSTYVYDPTTTAGTWTKVGLLDTARAAPAAAVLPDGRVLVAGGAYKDGDPHDYTGSSGITLAVSTSIGPGPGTGGGRRLDDMPPLSIGVALATAELFDPATGRWSPAGSMRFARAGAAAATLSDGRVLVVGAAGESFSAKMDPRVFDTAEVYDPATGRFSLVGSLPPIDRAAIAAAGVDVPTDSPSWTSTGTLVALPDGGALLVGHTDEWKHGGWVTRTFRFDAQSERWRQVGRASAFFYGEGAGTPGQTSGLDLARAFAAALPDGRVLVAGGTIRDATDEGETTRIARAYDSVTNTWSRLPSMPTGREGGLTVALADGSVLLIGGGAASAVRFVPSP
jgi:Kelch motif/Galactose oxidase, central domain